MSERDEILVPVGVIEEIDRKVAALSERARLFEVVLTASPTRFEFANALAELRQSVLAEALHAAKEAIVAHATCNPAPPPAVAQEAARSDGPLEPMSSQPDVVAAHLRAAAKRAINAAWAPDLSDAQLLQALRVAVVMCVMEARNVRAAK